MTGHWCWLCEWPEKPCKYNCFEIADKLKDEESPQLGLNLEGDDDAE